MDLLDKVRIVFWVVVMATTHVSIFVASVYLAYKRRKGGFLFLAVGFGLWILQMLGDWLAPVSFLLSFGKWISTMTPAGMILITIGFFTLIRTRSTGGKESEPAGGGTR